MEAGKTRSNSWSGHIDKRQDTTDGPDKIMNGLKEPSVNNIRELKPVPLGNMRSMYDHGYGYDYYCTLERCEERDQSAVFIRPDTTHYRALLYQQSDCVAMTSQPLFEPCFGMMRGITRAYIFDRSISYSHNSNYSLQASISFIAATTSEFLIQSRELNATWSVRRFRGQLRLTPDSAITSAFAPLLSFSLLHQTKQYKAQIMNPTTTRLASSALRRIIAFKPVSSTSRIVTAAGGYGRLDGYGLTVQTAGGYGARTFAQATQLRKDAQHPSPEFNPQSSGESKLYSFEDVCVSLFLAHSPPPQSILHFTVLQTDTHTPFYRSKN